MTNVSDVQDLMRKEFSAAKVRWLAILTAQLLGLLIAVVGFEAAAGWTLAAASAALLVPALSAVLKHSAAAHHSRGEELRRLLVFVDGWGRQTDRETILVAVAHGTSMGSWDPPPSGSYYDSIKARGPARVVHIVQQSAFFTTSHATCAAMLCVAATVVAGTIGFGLLWVVANGLFDPEYAPKAVHAASALLAFAVSSEFLNLWSCFQRLARAAQDTLSKCESLSRTSTLDASDIALLTGSYDAAIGQSPPIPGLIYRAQRQRLDTAWKAYNASTAPAR
jgi:hypothetical protein